MAHTILSLAPEITGYADLDIKIHSHHDSVESLHDHVKKYILQKNQVAAAAEPAVHDHSVEWEKLENGFYGTTMNEETVMVWEKYMKPGRIYGETPRRRKIRIFMAIADDISFVPLFSKPVSKPSSPVAATGEAPSYDQVIVELKEKLAHRANANRSPVPLKTRRISEVQEEKVIIEDCFKAPKFIRTTLATTLTATPEDEMSIHPVWNIHVNPLWVKSGASADDDQPPTYEEVVSAAPDAYPIVEEDEESSEEVYYQKVKTDVTKYLNQVEKVHISSDDEWSSGGDESSSEEEEVDRYFSWPSLECPAEMSNFGEFWTEPIFQVTEPSDYYFNTFSLPDFPLLGGEEMTPLLNSDERLIRDLDQIDEETPVETADWLESYQKIINEWRAARGLKPHYEFDESEQDSEENSEYARESEDEFEFSDEEDSSVLTTSEEEYYTTSN